MVYIYYINFEDMQIIDHIPCFYWTDTRLFPSSASNCAVGLRNQMLA